MLGGSPTKPMWKGLLEGVWASLPSEQGQLQSGVRLLRAMSSAVPGASGDGVSSTSPVAGIIPAEEVP